ncbi:MAG: class B sortase [Lachnospiraceae bacterium]|nr:class B sortase [Lachnospiraceae bacterium]
MEERDVLKESDNKPDNNGDALARDEQKITMLRESLKSADTDLLVETYEMIVKKKRFFETEAGASYINELKQEIQVRNMLSKMDRKKEMIIATVMIAVAVICIIGAVRYGYNIFHEQYVYKESQEEIDNLKVMLDIDESSAASEDDVYVSLDIGVGKKILKKYRKIYEKNHDFIGWLTIPGTQLDYPVMHTGNNTYYLTHGFDRGKSEIGIPFLDMRNNWENPDDNLIIYGHNLKNGNMFGCLKNYLDKDYYDKHPVIQFDTLYEKAQYEIIIVGLSRVANTNEDVFRYYEFFNAESGQDFKHAIREMKKLERYSTGKKAKWGDKLITLSTCNDFVDNGRLFVVARKVITG